jgi:hypothetical protein
MSEQYEVKTYPMAHVYLDAGWYTRAELVALVENMDRLNQTNWALCEAVLQEKKP